MLCALRYAMRSLAQVLAERETSPGDASRVTERACAQVRACARLPAFSSNQFPCFNNVRIKRSVGSCCAPGCSCAKVMHACSACRQPATICRDAGGVCKNNWVTSPCITARCVQSDHVAPRRRGGCCLHATVHLLGCCSRLDLGTADWDATVHCFCGVSTTRAQSAR
jgi:hypothetical protein